MTYKELCRLVGKSLADTICRAVDKDNLIPTDIVPKETLDEVKTFD